MTCNGKPLSFLQKQESRKTHKLGSNSTGFVGPVSVLAYFHLAGTVTRPTVLSPFDCHVCWWNSEIPCLLSKWLFKSANLMQPTTDHGQRTNDCRHYTSTIPESGVTATFSESPLGRLAKARALLISFRGKTWVTNSSQGKRWSTRVSFVSPLSSIEDE